jgi:hypothetical protein
MRSGLVAAALLVAGALPALARDPERIARFVQGLPSEADECAFLRQLCRGAEESLGREARTPGGRDLLATRQAAIAEARVLDARDAARAIERKRGRRLACFDDPVCRRILPKP